jgi:hypothetical protein
MQVTNTNGQLRIVSNSNTQFYQYGSISNVSWNNTNGSYYILLTLDKDYFVRFPLSVVTNQPTWTNDSAGANNAVTTISGWISSSVQSVSSTANGAQRTPGIIRPANVSGNVNTVAPTFYSVSVANIGAADGTVLGSVIKPGEVLNFSGDALNNYFTSFAYDATGTEFIIIYVA